MERLIVLSLILLLIVQHAFACVDEHKDGSGMKIRGFDDASMAFDSDAENEREMTSFLEQTNEDDAEWHEHRRHRRPRRRGLSALEAAFAAQPSRHTARQNLRFLTSEPHMAGTKQDEILAHWMQRKLKAAGADESWVDPVDAFLSYPKHRPKLAMFCKHNESKVVWEASLTEDVLPSDDTSDTFFRNHTFNGYSPSGRVKGKLVYANFGTPEDFAVLRRFNVSVRNKIVLVRYGKCFRGLKAMNAQKRGAIGVIIFSDPHEDGYTVGATYPHGPWRPSSSVQRGSVQFNSLCAGDPRRVATKNDTLAKCGYEPRELYPRIPVLPISYKDALPLLKILTGPYSPPEFVGTLQVAYKLGPSEHSILLETRNRYSIEKIWNAFGVFKGVHYGTHHDRPLIIGNHRDAWVFGKILLVRGEEMRQLTTTKQALWTQTAERRACLKLPRALAY
jgi:N-acetylated-alpha-linked acidic dipeptidase